MVPESIQHFCLTSKCKLKILCYCIAPLRMININRIDHKKCILWCGTEKESSFNNRRLTTLFIIEINVKISQSNKKDYNITQLYNIWAYTRRTVCPVTETLHIYVKCIIWSRREMMVISR